MGRIEEINEAMEAYLQESKPAKLYEAMRHLPLAGGKRLRPIVAILSCEAVGGDGKKAIPFGIALELIHTFTLVHDDIMDRDEERRDMPSVHKKFGEATAIIAGDALFAKAFEVTAETDERVACRLVKNISVMSREICEGQQMDMSFEEMEETSEDDFLKMIEKKTAKMFEHAAYGGALIGGGNEEEADALRSYGKNLGMAFQIWDDYLDVMGEKIGKPVGSDIREGKKTIIFLHAQKTPYKEKLSALHGKKDATKEEINTVIDIFKKAGSLDYARNKAFAFANEAKKFLDTLKESSAKEKLMELVDFAVKREK